MAMLFGFSCRWFFEILFPILMALKHPSPVTIGTLALVLIYQVWSHVVATRLYRQA